MSRLLIAVSESEIDVGRRAQREELYGWKNADVRPSDKALAEAPIPEFEVGGEGCPASIAWLHRVVMTGLGDSYNYADRDFLVKVTYGDRLREPSLEKVESVILHYREVG